MLVIVTVYRTSTFSVMTRSLLFRRGDLSITPVGGGGKYHCCPQVYAVAAAAFNGPKPTGAYKGTPDDAKCVKVNLGDKDKPEFHLARHVISRHDSTRSTCGASRASRVERVDPCCSTRSTQPKCMGSTHRTCRVVT